MAKKQAHIFLSLLVLLALAPLSRAADLPEAAAARPAPAGCSGTAAHGYAAAGQCRTALRSIEYAECLSIAEKNPAHCRTLEGLEGPKGNSAAGDCLNFYNFSLFVLNAVQGKDPAAESDFRLPYILDAGKNSRAFALLSRAYRAGYMPVCAILSYGDFLPPGVNPYDFNLLCRTSLYVPGDAACEELKGEEWGYARCLGKADLAAGIKSGGRSCRFPACRAVFSGAGACSAILQANENDSRGEAGGAP
ncbi:MAG TPA: hypothetical protein PKI19_07020 [Elusimicrobiales bacterium]|nr:hypothetical protein [Elusimicrobiales bacterium]